MEVKIFSITEPVLRTQVTLIRAKNLDYLGGEVCIGCWVGQLTFHLYRPDACLHLTKS